MTSRNEIVKIFFEEFVRKRDKLADLIQDINSRKEKLEYAQIIFNRLIFFNFVQKIKLVEDLITISKKDSVTELNFYSGIVKKILTKISNIKLFLFEEYSLEKKYPNIALPIVEIERIISFLREYQWFTNETASIGVENALTPGILGHIFEKAINIGFEKENKKKKIGAYYTPDVVTSYLSEQTVLPYFEKKIQSKFNKKFSSLSEIFEPKDKNPDLEVLFYIIDEIFPNLKILDNSCGTGNFLLAYLNLLRNLYARTLFALLKDNNFKNRTFDFLKKIDSNVEHFPIYFENSNQFSSDGKWSFLIKKIISDSNIYGVDLDAGAIETAKLILYLYIIGDLELTTEKECNLPNINFNIVCGNSLIGFIDLKSSDLDINIEKDILTNKLNQRYLTYINSKLSQDSQITLEDLKKLTPLHWPVVFSKLVEKFDDSFKPEFDIIIGNPPYGNLLSPIEKVICNAERLTTTEIAATFLERSLELNRENGSIGLIMTHAITFHKKLSPIRNKLKNSYETCKIATFDRDNCRFFECVTLSVSIVLCINRNYLGRLKGIYNKECDFWTSIMYRTMPKLSEIVYQRANRFLLGNTIGVDFSEEHRLPKIGDNLVLDIIKKLVNQINRDNRLNILGDLIGPSSIVNNEQEFKSKALVDKRIFWIRISGNYWYNAWNKPPYFGTQIACSEIKENSLTILPFILILINSSLFYAWFRIYGDGRHMNSDIMNEFPLPLNFEQTINPLYPFLESFACFLMDIMFQNFDGARNRFISSKFKVIIDGCDQILGMLYNLTEEEIKFIQNFEPEIRTGIKLPDTIKKEISELMYNYSVVIFENFKKKIINLIKTNS